MSSGVDLIVQVSFDITWIRIPSNWWYNHIKSKDYNLYLCPYSIYIFHILFSEGSSIPTTPLSRDDIKMYICYVIFEENAMGVLPRWALCPMSPNSSGLDFSILKNRY